MTARLLEAFFRHKLVILLPPLLILLIVSPIAVLTTPVYYETWSGIWVDRATYLNSNNDWNIWATPAQNQITRLSELLRTRAFVNDVAKRTSLAPLVGSARGEERIAILIGDGLTVAPNGSHLVTVRFRADTPRLSYELLNAIVNAFKEKMDNDRVNQASLAISFYESRLQAAQDELGKSSDAVRQYSAANPRLAASISSNGQAAQLSAAQSGVPITAADPQLGDLLGSVEFKQKEVDRLRQALEQARFDASASLEGQELGFQIVDPPQMPTSATRQLRKQLIYPIAGAVGGLALSVIMLVLFVAGDRSVRSELDLLPTAQVLGVVPRLRLKRLPKRLRAAGTRRAMGFVAGAALPAPGGAPR